VTHHKSRKHGDFAETKAGRERKVCRRIARAAKQRWLYESAAAR
jgi:hypothetical protein